MNHFETDILNNTPFNQIRNYRYVEDTLILYKEDIQLDTLIDKLHKIHQSINFAKESESNGTIKFLDLQIIKKK